METASEKDSTRPSNFASGAHNFPAENSFSTNVVSQNSPTMNVTTGSVEATSESGVYNAVSSKPATRNNTPAGNPFEKVLLRNYTEFRAFKGKLTIRRRTKPSDQLE